MANKIQATISHEEFEKRLDTNNSRLRQSLTEAQERVQQLEALIARKKVFAQRLAQVQGRKDN